MVKKRKKKPLHNRSNIYHNENNYRCHFSSEYPKNFVSQAFSSGSKFKKNAKTFPIQYNDSYFEDFGLFEGDLFHSGKINPKFTNDEIRVKLRDLVTKLKLFLYKNGIIDEISRRGSQFVKPIGERNIKIVHIDLRKVLGYGIDGDPFNRFKINDLISKRSFMDLYSRNYYSYIDIVSIVELKMILLEIESFTSKIFINDDETRLDFLIQGIQNILSMELRTFIRKKEIVAFLGISKKILYNEKMGKKPRFKT